MVSCTGSSPRITGGDAFSDTRVDTGTDPVPEAPCFAVCADGCEWPGDPCWSACEDAFHDCSGEDIAGLGACVDGCAASSLDCPEACERPGTGYDERVECTTGCEIGFTACMSGCF
jgi:hypothetical protein